MSDLVITNVRLVTPQSVVESGTLTVLRGRIHSLRPGGVRGEPHAPVTDGRGCWLLPGLVDLHNDGIEQEIQPRPRATFPVSVALQSMENRLVSHGITTIFHSFSFMDGREGTLEPEALVSAVRDLGRLRRAGIIRHLVHARYEVIELHHAERIRALIRDGLVDLLSFMDHTPGQGQFRNAENFINYYTRKYHLAVPDLQRLIKERVEKSRNPAVEGHLRMLVEEAGAARLPMASHDDDSVERVRAMHARGVGIVEFPIELGAAAAAAALGMHVAVGAPNVLRGGSTSGNLDAAEAIRAGSADILCSDYFTPSLLHTVFGLHRSGALPFADAVRMASLNPARAAKIAGEVGSLETGKMADMILVSETDGLPSVIAAWVGGRQVFEKHDSGRRAIGDSLVRDIVSRETTRVP
jgi:alpha-D-ribose 1-methylphosphonate 5-triphosphate diphosphatase